jgi:hypothetical protein
VTSKFASKGANLKVYFFGSLDYYDGIITFWVSIALLPSSHPEVAELVGWVHGLDGRFGSVAQMRD